MCSFIAGMLADFKTPSFVICDSFDQQGEY